MKPQNLIYLIVSIILAYILQIFIPYPFTGIAVGLPLGFLSKRASAISGFLIGFLSSLSLYLIYPLNDVNKLSTIMGELIGVNIPTIVILIYPFIYGLISLISAIFFSYILVSK